LGDACLFGGQRVCPYYSNNVLSNHISFLRDPIIGPCVKITIVEGKATDLLKKDFKQHPQTSQYIDRMVEKEKNMAQASTLVKVSAAGKWESSVKTNIDFETTGIIDTRGLMGEEGLSPHFQKIRFQVNIQTEESEEKIEQSDEKQRSITRKNEVFPGYFRKTKPGKRPNLTDFRVFDSY
jgi:hypothetical protein